MGCGQPSEPEKDTRVRTSGAPPAKGWDPLGVPDDIGPAVIGRVFRDWRTDQIYAQDIPSGNQPMPAIVVRLHL